MNEHIAAVHDDDGKKPFKCDTCNACYKTRDGLKKHTSSTHENKRFRCDKCAASFTQNGHLNIHNKTVHDEYK